MQEKEKKKMQDVSFRHIGEMLDYLPPDQLELVELLRELVFECIPDVKEKMTYNIPFYRLFGSICYIWPGAVAWGGKTWPGVTIGFNKGYLLGEIGHFLEAENRKHVWLKRYFKPEEVDADQIRACLFASVDLDKQLFLEKRVKKASKTKT
jgi:hypothetical protein